MNILGDHLLLVIILTFIFLHIINEIRYKITLLILIFFNAFFPAIPVPSINKVIKIKVTYYNANLFNPQSKMLVAMTVL